MAVITVMFQKRWEIPEAQIKPKTVLIWWIPANLFKNSLSCLSGDSRRWWLEHYGAVPFSRSAHKSFIMFKSIDSRFARSYGGCLFVSQVSMQTGFSKCLLCVFTFYLMHWDDTESKHIHTDALLSFTGTFQVGPSLWVQLSLSWSFPLVSI